MKAHPPIFALKADRLESSVHTKNRVPNPATVAGRKAGAAAGWRRKPFSISAHIRSRLFLTSEMEARRRCVNSWNIKGATMEEEPKGKARVSLAEIRRVTGHFGGRKGGKSKSEKKLAACRKNAVLGGRPRKAKQLEISLEQ